MVAHLDQDPGGKRGRLSEIAEDACKTRDDKTHYYENRYKTHKEELTAGSILNVEISREQVD